jgi:Rrf2 family nitric oxide-sensitive transcriptional repressor
MRLTSFTDYGLRALMRLAGEPDRAFTTDDMASEFRISRNHLTKIIGALSGGRIVVTHRGRNGGFELARAADEITIGEIVRLLESGQPLVECFRSDGGACTLMPQCRLKGRLAAAREAFLAELDRTTLADCAHPAQESMTPAR